VKETHKKKGETTMKPKKEKRYMHLSTGAIDTKEGWIDSYLPEELEERGLTAEQAFFEDDGGSLIEVEEKKSDEANLTSPEKN